MITAFRGDGQRPAYLALTADSFGRPIQLAVVTEDMGRFNLTGYTVEIAIRFVKESRPIFTKSVTVVDAVNGVVEFTPDGRDFPRPTGLYYGRFILKKEGVNIETREFPVVLY